MRGLVLKDIFGVRFHMFGALALMVIPLVTVFVGIEGMDGAPVQLQLLLGGIFDYVEVTLCSSFLVNTLGYDERSGWAKIQRTMPLTGGKIIGAKFLAMGLILAMLTVMSLVVNILYAVIFGILLEGMIALPLVMCMIQAIALSPTFALGYRFGAKSVTAAYIVIMVVLAAAMIGLIIPIICGNITAAAIRIICYAVLPAVTAAVVSVSWITGKSAVEVDI